MVGHACIEQPEGNRMSEIEEREQHARRSQQQLEQLNAQRSEDWQRWFKGSLYAELMSGKNPLIDGLGDVIATERAARRKEVQHAVEEQQRKYDAKLEALEQHQRQVQQEQAANNQAAWEKWFHSFYGELIATERAARQKELKAAVEEQERKHDAKLAALEQRQHQAQQEQTVNNQAAWEKFYGEVLATERAARQKEVKAAIEEQQRICDAKLQALEQRLKSVPGKLPIAKTWQPETVVYQAEFVSHEGALWQARKDTAQSPGGAEWVCVARAGRDALTPTIRGTYDVYAKYQKLDVIVSDGAAFIASKDDPGLCPGDGWQLLSRQGKRGQRGQPGERGPAGPKGDQGPPAEWPQLVSSKIDENYNLTILRSDNSLEIIPLRDAFERFYRETSE
jgi:hypothetical protein